jgi:hypothetical protein
MSIFIVKANKSELESIGISYDITYLEGTLIKIFDDGWLSPSINHNVGKFEFTNAFDLPKYMCINKNIFLRKKKLEKLNEKRRN